MGIAAASRIGLGFLVVAAAATPGARKSAEAQELVAAGRVPVPKPARGQGDKCVADTDWMRSNHMTALNHQRDDTVHDGIRTKRFSLKGCIECHAVKGADGKAVAVTSPAHFCRTCHDYAAVRIDCFECHASRPEAKAAGAGAAASGHHPETDTAALAQYLRSVRR